MSDFEIRAAVERERQRVENQWFKLVLFIMVVAGMSGLFS